MCECALCERARVRVCICASVYMAKHNLGNLVLSFSLMWSLGIELSVVRLHAGTLTH